MTIGSLCGLIFNLNARPINIGRGLGAAWGWIAVAFFVYFGIKLALADNRTEAVWKSQTRALQAAIAIDVVALLT